ncbi:MAG: hypothetical protein WAL50_07070 [Kineosporiaceae bacterium]
MSVSEAVTRLYEAVNGWQLPLDAPGAAPLRAERERTVRLLESYTIPRISERAAPLVVVVGGPTGAGKSTLTNSLVGASVSQSGILRPTTREPVLIYNPADGPALHTLGLVREKDEAPTADASRWVRLRAVPNADLVPGLAVIDSPDLDSRVESNRELAGQLLAVADLWMFVTTGTDYADALSWDLLGVASRRKVAVAVVLNRLRQRESTTVRNHFATLLTGAGLAHAHVFTLPEVTLVEERIPVQFILSMQRWLERQARRGRERDEHLARTFDGTIDQAVTAALSLADAAADQVVAARRLRVDLESIFSRAREEVRGRCTDASLVTEELIAAWRAADQGTRTTTPGQPQPAGSGLFRRRSRAGAATADPHLLVGEALRASIAALMREQADQALFRVADRWHSHPAAALAQGDDVATLPADFPKRVDAATLDWLGAVHQRVNPRGAQTNPATDPLTLAVATLAVEGRPGRSGEVGPEQAERVASVRDVVQRRIAAVEGDAAATTALARDAWLDLVGALNAVMMQDEARLADLLDDAHVFAETGESLREAAELVARLRARQEDSRAG